MKKLYKFYWDCGRGGNLRGLFIENDETVKGSMGKKVYFGEVLGKHSEVFGHLEECDLEVVSEDQTFIEQFEKIVGTSFGYNPIKRIMEEE